MDEIASRLNAVEQGVRERETLDVIWILCFDSQHYKLDEDSRQHSRSGTERWHENREHEQHRAMRAPVKECHGDVNKLLVEYQQDIGIESGQPEEFNQELKDCVDEPRRGSQRVPRLESLRMWLRVQVCLRESLRVWIPVWIRVWTRVCRHAERKRCAMVLVNLSVDKRDYERMRVQVEQLKCKCRQRQLHNIVDVWKTSKSCNECHQFETSRIVAMGETRCENQLLERKSDSVWSTWCKT